MVLFDCLGQKFAWLMKERRPNFSKRNSFPSCVLHDGAVPRHWPWPVQETGAEGVHQGNGKRRVSGLQEHQAVASRRGVGAPCQFKDYISHLPLQLDTVMSMEIVGGNSGNIA